MTPKKQENLYERFKKLRDCYRTRLETLTGKDSTNMRVAGDFTRYLKETAQQLRQMRGKKSTGYFSPQESKEITELYKQVILLKKECDSKKNWIQKAVEMYEHMRKDD